MKSNPRTYKVQAYKELNNVTESDMVSWAVSMIENGFNGKYLMQLASFTPPYNYFEVINLLEKTLKELCIPLIIGKEAILKYTSDIIDDLIDGLKEYNEVMHEVVWIMY